MGPLHAWTSVWFRDWLGSVQFVPDKSPTLSYLPFPGDLNAPHTAEELWWKLLGKENTHFVVEEKSVG